MLRQTFVKTGHRDIIMLDSPPGKTRIKVFILCFLKDIGRLRNLKKKSLNGPQPFSCARHLHFNAFLGLEVS